jgi:hypothetical protein
VEDFWAKLEEIDQRLEHEDRNVVIVNLERQREWFVRQLNDLQRRLGYPGFVTQGYETRERVREREQRW